MIIGLTIVAFETSLPEFANTLTSIKLSALINPILMEKEFLYLVLPIVLLVFFSLTVSLKRDNIIGRKTGLVFLILYLMFFYA
jgi:cation:H+ antiporter